MKSYNLDTVFTFGKFKEKTLREVIHAQSSYVNWCIIHVSHFYIPDAIIEEIKATIPNFSMSSQAQSKLDEKRTIASNQHNDNDDDYSWEDNDNRSEADKWREVLGDGYAFEGDSSNYWNVD